MNGTNQNVWSGQAILRRSLALVDRWPRLRFVLGFCLFETAFYFAYRYGMSFSQACASPFWFPDSVLLCALLLNRPGRWWLFVFAPLPIRLFVTVPPGVPLWFLLTAFAIDSAKGVLAAAARRRFARNPLQLETVPEFAAYCLFVVLLIPAASAFAGAAARHFLGQDYWLAWEQWFLGNVLTHLVVTPAILYWVFGASRYLRLPSQKQFLEGALVAAGLMLTGYLAFNTSSVRIGLADARFYAPVPFLFWAAIRFGMFGASGAITIMAALAVEAALDGRGPFAGLSPADLSLALQHFLLLRAAPLYVVAILVEQTKRAEAEAQKQRAEFAHVARVSTMGTLAGSLAHELNQPLTAILSNAQAGSRFLAEPTPNVAEVREVLQDIAQDTKRAGEIIRQLRKLVKKEDLRFEALDLNLLIQDVARLLRSDAVIRQVQIVLDFQTEPRPVRGDAVQLQHVMLNLLLNASDAMKGVPESERTICVRARQPNGVGVQIEVSDRGPGIHPERLARLFEPFQTTKQEGLGLGLAISRSIVEAHGGRLWAINNPDRGATFCFTVPLFSAPPNSE